VLTKYYKSVKNKNGQPPNQTECQEIWQKNCQTDWPDQPPRQTKFVGWHVAPPAHIANIQASQVAVNQVNPVVPVTPTNPTSPTVQAVSLAD
jgi:hypothetical protein